MKVLVLGNSGSGKTSYAKALVSRHGLVHLDLDAIVWEPGPGAQQRDTQAVDAMLREFIATHDAWVIEGCYGDLIEAASPHCTRLVFMNPGLQACLANNRRRPWEPHKYASRQEQEAMLENLQAWVADYYRREDAWSYCAHRRIFERHAGAKTEITDLQDPSLEG